MRTLSIAILAATILAAAAALPAGAATAPPTEGRPALALQREVPPHDDTRVPVQLVVLGAAAVVVVGVGTAAHLLRRKLGLTARPPQGEASHH